MLNQSIVTAKWLKKNLANPDLIILDSSVGTNQSNLNVKHPGEQIPGARFFDFKMVFSDQGHSVPNMMPSADLFTKGAQNLGINSSSIIIVYDNLGVYTSPRAWWMFKTMGHHNVAVLDGGLNEWKILGYRTEPLSKKRLYNKGNFKTEFNPKQIVDVSQIKQNIISEQAILVDARSEDRFNGKVPEPREGMKSGHIPKSVNLPYKLVLEGYCFRNKSELRVIFDHINPEKKPLFFTCGSGITACIILLASSLVNKGPKSLYDGSWSEWGTI